MSGKSTAQIDAKREEFRKYLEKEGVLESLTKALVIHFSSSTKSGFLKCSGYFLQVALYEEPDKPGDALSFVRNNFASTELQTLKAQLENLSKENDELKDKNTTLENENSSLKNEVKDLKEQLEKSQTSVASPQLTTTEEPAEVNKPEGGEAIDAAAEPKSPNKSAQESSEDEPKSSEEAAKNVTNDAAITDVQSIVEDESTNTTPKEQEPRAEAEAMETETPDVETTAATSEPKSLEGN